MLREVGIRRIAVSMTLGCVFGLLATIAGAGQSLATYGGFALSACTLLVLLARAEKRGEYLSH